MFPSGSTWYWAICKLELFEKKNSTVPQFCMSSQLSKITLHRLISPSMFTSLSPVNGVASCFMVCQPERTFMIWSMHNVSLIFFCGLDSQGGKRSDGRNPYEIRLINSQCGLLPRAHGSALFTRGETQVPYWSFLQKTWSRRSVGWLCVYSSLAWWLFVVLCPQFSIMDLFQNNVLFLMTVYLLLSQSRDFWGLGVFHLCRHMPFICSCNQLWFVCHVVWRQ